MSDMKPSGVKVNLGGKEYSLLFNVNAIDLIQDKFDIDIGEITTLLKDTRKAYKVLKFLLMVLVNEGIDEFAPGEPHVDEQTVGRKLTIASMDLMKTKVLRAFTDGAPDVDEDDPNPTGGQQEN